ncbi:MAG TPA: SRPBCC family protein [Candidatus Acidoferrales bacterium]|nr:SRPBCC family protein [Candidatus Acidoferrales bacterium]
MSVLTFRKRSRIRASAEAVFRWHAEPGALERLTPPWEPLRIVSRSGGLEDGARVAFRVGPLGLLWVAEHRDVIPGRGFRDVQVRGPFRRWEHTHRFIPDGADACCLEDEIVYEFPLGWLGRLLAGRFVRRKLERLFDYRHRLTAETLEPTLLEPPAVARG